MMPTTERIKENEFGDFQLGKVSHYQLVHVLKLLGGIITDTMANDAGYVTIQHMLCDIIPNINTDTSMTTVMTQTVAMGWTIKNYGNDRVKTHYHSLALGPNSPIVLDVEPQIIEVEKVIDPRDDWPNIKEWIKEALIEFENPNKIHKAEYESVRNELSDARRMLQKAEQEIETLRGMNQRLEQNNQVVMKRNEKVETDLQHLIDRKRERG
jgi:hypothetical protein